MYGHGYGKSMISVSDIWNGSFVFLMFTSHEIVDVFAVTLLVFSLSLSIVASFTIKCAAFADDDAATAAATVDDDAPNIILPSKQVFQQLIHTFIVYIKMCGIK